MYKISNGGVQPTWRGGVGNLSGLVGINTIYGSIQSLTTNIYTSTPFRYNNSAANFKAFTGTTTFDNPFSSTLNTTQSTSTTITGNMPGFILHTVGA